jgi:hypothetical protein
MILQNVGQKQTLVKMRKAEKIDFIKAKFFELLVAKVNCLEKKRTIRLCIP